MEQLSYYDYTNWGPDFYSMEKYGPATRHGRRIIKKMIQGINATSILDIGCGNGCLVEELINNRQSNGSVYGCDLSSSCVMAARRRLPGVHFFLCDLLEKPPASYQNKFDLIICSEVIEHIEDDISALKNSALFTKRYAIFTVPLEKQLSPASRAVGHYHAYSVKEFLAKLEKAGFRVIKKICWGYPVYSPFYKSIFKDKHDLSWFKKNYTPFQKMLCNTFYCLFWLNLSVFGDRLFVLVEKTTRDTE